MYRNIKFKVLRESGAVGLARLRSKDSKLDIGSKQKIRKMAMGLQKIAARIDHLANSTLDPHNKQFNVQAGVFSNKNAKDLYRIVYLMRVGELGKATRIMRKLDSFVLDEIPTNIKYFLNDYGKPSDWED